MRSKEVHEKKFNENTKDLLNAFKNESILGARKLIRAKYSNFKVCIIKSARKFLNFVQPEYA